MLTAVCLIDFYIINVIRLKIDFKPKPDKAILFETLKYALPLIVTNTSIWAVLNINKFVFQYNEMFHDTAVAGVSWLFTTSILTPLFSTFLFAIFPAIIKKFEGQNRIKPLVTNTIQLYCALFIPVVVFFCGFSKDIANFAFSGKYNDACILISFFAVSLFFHELMKLFNVKYHLKNKTYIEMPLSEVIVDFYDQLKSRTKGYASMDYEFKEYKRSDLVKLDVMLAGEVVDALSAIVHKDNAFYVGQKLTAKLKDIIPRQMFEVPIQAAVGGRIIARTNIKALRKSVLDKCYGGDISRKRKLLEKQKKGKKRMKAVGRVEVPQEAFMAVLSLNDE